MSFIPPNYVTSILSHYGAGKLDHMLYYDNYKPELYKFLEEILNLNDRIDLPENLKNILIDIDYKYLSEIAKNYNSKYEVKKILILYKFEQEKVYDKLFIEKAKIKIEEQDEKISSLKNEIDEMKKIIETMKTNLLNFNYQYY
jgi:predicted RNase H-like nuclease (RuvC/YqgF family)